MKHDNFPKEKKIVIITKQDITNRILGKNYYVTNYRKNISLTINSKTFRIITVD